LHQPAIVIMGRFSGGPTVLRGEGSNGLDDWRAKVTRQLKLEHTFRPKGRTKKSESTNTKNKSPRK